MKALFKKIKIVIKKTYKYYYKILYNTQMGFILTD